MSTELVNTIWPWRERRATSVKEFLVMQGVASERIEVISFGEERAAAYGSDDEAWRLNRRVELK